MRNKLIIILAIVFGIIAAVGNFTYMKNVKQTYMSSGNFVQVATAKQKIPARSLLTEEMLEFKDMPVEYVLPGTVMEKKDAVGKMARSDIFPGELIIDKKIAGQKDTDAGLSPKVSPGKRAISVPVNNVTALHGLVRIGDHVDILVTFKGEGEGRQALTSTVIQDVPVLAINKTIENVESKEELQTVTVMVDPTQAQQIALSIQQGSIQLSMRSPGDSNINPLPSSNLEHLKR
jgi:pilus assembly protein CpaB